MTEKELITFIESHIREEAPFSDDPYYRGRRAVWELIGAIIKKESEGVTYEQD